MGTGAASTIKKVVFRYQDTHGYCAPDYLSNPEILSLFKQVIKANTLEHFFVTEYAPRPYSNAQEIIDIFKNNHTMQRCSFGDKIVENALTPYFEANALISKMSTFLPSTTCKIVVSYLDEHLAYARYVDKFIDDGITSCSASHDTSALGDTVEYFT